MPSVVSQTPALPAAEALAHFSRRLAYETDCWDVHEALSSDASDFVLLDVRTERLFRAGHVPGAISLPRREITVERMADWPMDTLFVVYCAGPHCNGANKAAVALASLGRPVKEMIGGIIGWQDEGLALATS